VIGYLTSKTSSPPTDVLDRKMLLREFLEVYVYICACLCVCVHLCVQIFVRIS